jgi:hypothetical protein
MKIAIIASVFAAALVSPAFSFGMLAPQGAHHEKITRDALGTVLGSATLESFAGKPGSPGAIGAPDENAIFSSRAHCDNGDHLAVAGYPQTLVTANAALTDCRAFIFAQIEQAVRDTEKLVTPDGKVVSAEFPSYISCTYVGDVSGRAKCNALQSMGKALHAAQDFYAHTNWVDEPAAGAVSPSNPPGLGKTGVSPFLASSTAAFPAGLISGCFTALPESAFCNYSGAARVKHTNLNKDEPTTTRGAINNNFARARAAAVEETRRAWTYFEGRLIAVYGARRGGVMVCAMRTDNASNCSP